MKKENTYSLRPYKVAQLSRRTSQPHFKGELNDSEVNEWYTQAFRSRYQKAMVFWPWMGDRLSPDQIHPLKQLLQSEVGIIFLPIKSNQSQWSLIVLTRKKAVSHEWVAKKVEIPGGFCGQSIVTQSLQILDQGLETYSAHHPDQVCALDRNDAIYTQIEQVLDRETDNGSPTTQGETDKTITPLDQTLPIAIAEHLKTKYRSRFEYQLAKLAEYDARGENIERLCEELAQLLAEMTPPARVSALQTLARSPLAKKPALIKVIDYYDQKQTKISANPYLLIPLPSLKTQSRKKSLEEKQKVGFNPPVSIQF
jgi:hypothetical protein